MVEREERRRRSSGNSVIIFIYTILSAKFGEAILIILSKDESNEVISEAGDGYLSFLLAHQAAWS